MLSRHGERAFGRIAVSVQLLLIGALLATGCAEQAPPVEPLRPVRTVQVYSGGTERVRSFSGTARAGQESRLSFKVAGTVEALDVNVGDRVRAGQVLARLDPQDYRLRVEDAQASLARARAEERNAEANYARVRELYENRNASLNALDAARAAFESATAALDSDGKKLEQARHQLSYTELKAPTAGAIAEVPVEINENVQPGQTVAVLNAGRRPEVEIGMPEVFIPRIREGQPVEVTFDALGDRTFAATVTEVGISSTGLATTFPVKVRMNRDEPDVLPGMAAEVHFRFEGQNDPERLVVPAFAVGEDREGRFVYVVEEIGNGVGRAVRREVTVGSLTADGGLEILRGLTDGERVITAGVSRIRDGREVRLDATGETAQ
jgi:RND family efflux transporter MFP subunit